MVARKVLLVAALLVAGVFPGVTGATTTINKQFAPPTIDPGDLSRLRITLFNSANHLLLLRHYHQSYYNHQNHTLYYYPY